MDAIVVHGGCPLNGEVRISGAKNAALPIIASSLLANGNSILKNVPQLRDIRTMVKLLERMGARVAFKDDVVHSEIDRLEKMEAPYDLVKTMRASVLVLGPLVARYGRARVSLPGGCAIGARPINYHLQGLKALGAEIKLEHGYIEAHAKRLQGAEITFEKPTVGGTENVMMAAVLAHGQTIIENAAREPEIAELAIVLNKMGAHVSGAGTGIITIEGVDELKPVEHSIIPDRIEAGTFLVAGGLMGGELLLRYGQVDHIVALVEKLCEAGLQITQEQQGIRIRGNGELQPVNVTTLPYPGFPTDMQAQFMTLMTRAQGTSVITETIFENRFMHVNELMRMGADIKITGNTAVVKGPAELSGAPVMATDLRASASLILAGLTAKGTTEVSRIYHLDRGYEQIESKLKKLGADIERVRR